MTRHVHQALAALLLFLALEGAGSAGSFQVSPVRATLTSSQPVAALTVRNTGSSAAVVQLQAMRWTQADDKDALIPANELLATPPIFTLAPGASQIIRVGLRQPADPDTERAYRLLLEEVPPPPQPGFTGLRVALKISLPIFVPASAAAQVDLQWHATPSADGTLILAVHNNGQAHAHMSGLTATMGDAHVPLPDANVYVLAGVSRQWRLPMHGTPGQIVHLAAHDDSQVMSTDVTVTDR